MRSIVWLLFALLLTLTRRPTPVFANHDDGDDNDTVVLPVDQGISAHLPTIDDNVQHNHQPFQAAVSQLMDIIVNSLYTDRDVFMRELVSNSADALEKVRLLSLKNESVWLAPDGSQFDKLEIIIETDKKRGEIYIRDTGIGMTRDELINNLGTVASSGTGQFLQSALKSVEGSGSMNAGLASSSSLIGQFGVGFYSAFLVADSVTVVSKHPMSESQWIWKSTINDKKERGFTVLEDPKGPTLKRGTLVVLKVRKDQRKYLETSTLKRVVSRFSQFLGQSLYLKEGSDKLTKLNPHEPLWMRDRDTIEEKEYNEFYKVMARDSFEPIAHTHFAAEGDIGFRSILYLPANLKDVVTIMTTTDKVSNIRLFVRRVLIADNLDNFLPRWLGFVKGIIDSDDLPLKVDRETFSETKVLKSIRGTVIRKIFDLFKSIARDGEKSEMGEYMEELKKLEDGLSPTERDKQKGEVFERYKNYKKWMSVWGKFGQSLVLGCAEDATRDEREKIAHLMRFPSSKSPEVLNGFDHYVSRMHKGQKRIYYMTGDNVEQIMASPYLELFRQYDVEVLFFLRPLEEQCAEQLRKFKNFDLQSIEKGDNLIEPTDLMFAKDDTETALAELADQKLQFQKKHKAFALLYKPLVDWVQEYLGLVKAQYVIISKSLIDSPAMISVPAHGLTANAERLFKASAFANQMTLDAVGMMKTLELNPEHPFVHYLLTKVEALNKSKKPKIEAELKSAVDILYEASIIASGFQPRRPALVINKLYSALNQEIGLDSKLMGKNAGKFQVKIPKEIMSKVEEEMNKKLESPTFDTLKFDEMMNAEEEEELDILKGPDVMSPSNILKTGEGVSDEL